MVKFYGEGIVVESGKLVGVSCSISYPEGTDWSGLKYEVDQRDGAVATCITSQNRFIAKVVQIESGFVVGGWVWIGKDDDGDDSPYWCGVPAAHSGCHKCPMHKECDRN